MRARRRLWTTRYTLSAKCVAKTAACATALRAVAGDSPRTRPQRTSPLEPCLAPVCLWCPRTSPADAGSARVGRYGLELSAIPIDIIMAREARRMSIG